MTTQIYSESMLNDLRARSAAKWKREPDKAKPKHFSNLEKLLGGPVPEEIVQLNTVIDGFGTGTSVSPLAIAGNGYGSSAMSYLRVKRWTRKDWIPVGVSYLADVYCLLAEPRFKRQRPIGLVCGSELKFKYLVASSLPKLLELWLAIGYVKNDDWHRDKKAVLKIDPDLAKITAYPKAWEVMPAAPVQPTPPQLPARPSKPPKPRRSDIKPRSTSMDPRTFNLVVKRLTAGVSSSLEPADEKHLARMEEFLERPLPPGLRDFLSFTDGCCPDWGVTLYGVTEKNSATSMLGLMKSKRQKWISRHVIPIGHDGWGHHWCLVDEPKYKRNGPVCAVPIGERRIDFVVASTYEVFLRRIATVDWGWACAKSRSTERKVLTADPGIAKFKQYTMPWQWEDAAWGDDD